MERGVKTKTLVWGKAFINISEINFATYFVGKL